MEIEIYIYAYLCIIIIRAVRRIITSTANLENNNNSVKKKKIHNFKRKKNLSKISCFCEFRQLKQKQLKQKKAKNYPITHLQVYYIFVYPPSLKMT